MNKLHFMRPMALAMLVVLCVSWVLPAAALDFRSLLQLDEKKEYDFDTIMGVPEYASVSESGKNEINQITYKGYLYADADSMLTLSERLYDQLVADGYAPSSMNANGYPGILFEKAGEMDILLVVIKALSTAGVYEGRKGVFAELFGGAQENAAASNSYTYPVEEKCDICHGSGICQVCFGRGYFTYNTWGQGGSGKVTCEGCQGDRQCKYCK